MDVDRFVASIESHIDEPYQHQGRGPGGFDCIGLVIAALHEQGIACAAPADYQRRPTGDSLIRGIEASGLFSLRAQGTTPQAGDVLVFKIVENPQHVGVALDGGRFVHATWTGGKVRLAHLGSYWRTRLVKIYRWHEWKQ